MRKIQWELRRLGTAMGGWPLQAVKHVPPQRMALGQSWMIEIVARIVRHADFFHYAPGPNIRGNRERHERIQTQRIECMAYHRARGFRFEAAAPMLRREPPANFEARSARGLKCRHG